MRNSVIYKSVFWLIFSIIAASPARATSSGDIKFVSDQFSLQFRCVYGSPAREGRKYINDGYLGFKYAAFLYQKQLFGRSFRSRYSHQPLSIDFTIGVSDDYREFRSPLDWETNPYVFRHVDEVRALPAPKIFTLQLVIYQSEKWLNRFKTRFGQKLREVNLQELCGNVKFSSYVDGCHNKKVPVYTITAQDAGGRLTHHVRYGIFISLDDARNVAEKLSRDLGFEVQVLERTLTRKLIWKVLFDESFVI